MMGIYIIIIIFSDKGIPLRETIYVNTVWIDEIF